GAARGAPRGLPDEEAKQNGPGQNNAAADLPQAPAPCRRRSCRTARCGTRGRLGGARFRNRPGSRLRPGIVRRTSLPSCPGGGPVWLRLRGQPRGGNRNAVATRRALDLRAVETVGKPKFAGAVAAGEDLGHEGTSLCWAREVRLGRLERGQLLFRGTAS